MTGNRAHHHVNECFSASIRPASKNDFPSLEFLFIWGRSCIIVLYDDNGVRSSTGVRIIGRILVILIGLLYFTFTNSIWKSVKGRGTTIKRVVLVPAHWGKESTRLCEWYASTYNKVKPFPKTTPMILVDNILLNLILDYAQLYLYLIRVGNMCKIYSVNNKKFSFLFLQFF